MFKKTFGKFTKLLQQKSMVKDELSMKKCYTYYLTSTQKFVFSVIKNKKNL